MSASSIPMESDIVELLRNLHLIQDWRFSMKSDIDQVWTYQCRFNIGSNSFSFELKTDMSDLFQKVIATVEEKSDNVHGLKIVRFFREGLVSRFSFEYGTGGDGIFLTVNFMFHYRNGATKLQKKCILWPRSQPEHLSRVLYKEIKNLRLRDDCIQIIPSPHPSVNVFFHAGENEGLYKVIEKFSGSTITHPTKRSDGVWILTANGMISLQPLGNWDFFSEEMLYDQNKYIIMAKIFDDLPLHLQNILKI